MLLQLLLLLAIIIIINIIIKFSIRCYCNKSDL